MNKQIVPGCICSTYRPDDGRYDCSVTGDECMFMIPDAVACAQRFGEGPLASLEILSDQSMAIEHLQEDVLDLTQETARLAAELEEYRRAEADGLLVRLPGMLITPYDLNERYWICGWNSDDCTLTIQDRKLLKEAETALKAWEVPHAEH